MASKYLIGVSLSDIREHCGGTAHPRRIMGLFWCKLTAFSRVITVEAFADTFMQLERTLLRLNLGVSTEFLLVQDSRRLVIRLLSLE